MSFCDDVRDIDGDLCGLGASGAELAERLRDLAADLQPDDLRELVAVAERLRRERRRCPRGGAN